MAVRFEEVNIGQYKIFSWIRFAMTHELNSTLLSVTYTIWAVWYVWYFTVGVVGEPNWSYFYVRTLEIIHIHFRNSYILMVEDRKIHFSAVFCYYWWSCNIMIDLYYTSCLHIKYSYLWHILYEIYATREVA